MKLQPGWYWVESPVDIHPVADKDNRLYPALRRKDGAWEVWMHIGVYEDGDITGAVPMALPENAVTPEDLDPLLG
jgi:hypothetical protein